MKKLSLILSILVLAPATALAGYSESTFSKYENSAWLAAGFTEGGFSLGADYEYGADRTYGIGGLTRFYKKNDGSGKRADGIFMFGAFIRPHFHRRAWDLYVTPGIAIINIDAINGDDTTSLGPFFQVGLLYQMTDTMAMGLENMLTAVWFDDDYRGIVKEDIMFRARFSF